MRRLLVYLPTLVTTTICGLFLFHGPIAQLPHYNEFADQSAFMRVPHAADVFSNLGFALIAVWGLFRLRKVREQAFLEAGWRGYHLFLAGLLLTALGSGFYHLAPDNSRLLWDRLPIALACTGLLAAIRAETVTNVDSKANVALLAVCALFSVGWWWLGERHGVGDLRPYLLIQGLPLVLIPLWQWIYRAPVADRRAVGIALLLYVGAKIAELNDHQLFDLLGVISGHTLKHLLATAAAGVLVCRVVRRTREWNDLTAGIDRLAV
ncbi:MAG: hypothetical protein ABI171_21635 [Collimonas sp.]|uniref:hypothetical protein n=1 Tax=Collimonas sp. TaxID=1963772 RepID=UPI0032635D68